MQDPSDEEEDPQSQGESQSEEEEEDEDEDNEGAAEPGSESDHFTNSNLVVGHNIPRAFVVRGNKIGVFSTEGDRIKYDQTMKGIKNAKGKAFVPDQVCFALFCCGP